MNLKYIKTLHINFHKSPVFIVIRPITKITISTHRSKNDRETIYFWTQHIL